MARKDKSGGDAERVSAENTKVADIQGASKSLYEGKSYENGYPDTMQHHINRGTSKKVRRGSD